MRTNRKCVTSCNSNPICPKFQINKILISEIRLAHAIIVICKSPWHVDGMVGLRPQGIFVKCKRMLRDCYVHRLHFHLPGSRQVVGNYSLLVFCKVCLVMQRFCSRKTQWKFHTFRRYSLLLWQLFYCHRNLYWARVGFRLIHTVTTVVLGRYILPV